MRKTREERGIGLRQFAERLDVSPATLCGIEAGRTSVTPARLRRIAELLDLPAERLLAPGGALAREEQVAAEPPHWRSYPPVRFDAPLTGALDAFIEYGYHGASTREIARRGGISVPGLYHHYPTKQHMLVAIIEYVMNDILRRSLQARAQGRTPAERFALMVENLSLFHAMRRDLAFVGSSELRSLEPEPLARNREMRRQHKHMMDDEIEAAVAAGEFRCDDAAAACRAVVSLCVALPLWFRTSGPNLPRQVARQYVDYSLQLAGYTRSRDSLLRRLGVGGDPDCGHPSQTMVPPHTGKKSRRLR